MEYNEYTMAKKSGLTFYEKEKKINKHFLNEILEMIIASALCVFLAFVVTYVFGGRTGIIGDSMEPSIEASSEIFINRFVYMISSPKRGDIVVFLPYGNTNTHYYIKRVVGLPEEKVMIMDGRLMIDGRAIEPEDKYDYMIDSGIADTEFELAEDEFFVLGDNRNNSEDSRSGNIGPVKKENIIGKAWLIIHKSDGSVRLAQ